MDCITTRFSLLPFPVILIYFCQSPKTLHIVKLSILYINKVLVFFSFFLFFSLSY
ncbi:hypothetical protein BDA99DRAFT_510348 [Phascolomyces articulosus]|uniref:Uncharacterized protein n=1 Tax=Phascolomyces articulosus TaxID=60185 RepID=A0AAD5PF98_9FUNG|nr:hypothetical protein BDA99DRAFT_510348 [Phascolomyces articulosus]